MTRAIVAAAVAARVAVWWIKEGFVYPDEIFQYLEPAHLRLTGLGNMQWEFERGVRSWILPGYFGGIMWWLRHLPIDGFTVHRLIGLHNALLSVALVPAAARLAGTFGGPAAARTAALWTALYPPILFYLPHTLNEVPGLVLTTWGLAWWAESRGADRSPLPLRSGLAFGLAIVVRPTLVLWAVVPAGDWCVRREYRQVFAFVQGTLVVLALGGIVDWLTWGRPFHSTIEFVRYNLIEGGASDHGVSPWDFYLRAWLWERMGVGAVICVGLALLSGRGGWLMLAAAALPLAALTTVAHKEERFLLSSYPLLLVAGSLGMARLGGWMPGVRGRERLSAAVHAVATAAVLFAGLAGSLALDWRQRAGIFAGQRLVGAQPDARGVLIDDRSHMNGGYVVLDRNIPQLPFSTTLARHELYSHLVLVTGSREAAWAVQAGFEPIAILHEATVFRRSEW